MELGGMNSKRLQHAVTHLDTAGVCADVKFGVYFQTFGGSCVGDQVHDHFVTHQWVASPVLIDVAKQSMLDLIPLTGSRWQMTHTQLQSRPVGQSLQGHLPQPAATAVAASAIGHDQQLAGSRKSLCAHLLPP